MVAEEIQKNSLADSYKNYIDLFDIPRWPKTKKVGSELKPTEKPPFGKKKKLFFFHEFVTLSFDRVADG